MSILTIIWFVSCVTMIWNTVMMFEIVYRHRGKVSPEFTALSFAIAWVFFLGSVAFVLWTMTKITRYT